MQLAQELFSALFRQALLLVEAQGYLTDTVACLLESSATSARGVFDWEKVFKRRFARSAAAQAIAQQAETDSRQVDWRLAHCMVAQSLSRCNLDKSAWWAALDCSVHDLSVKSSCQVGQDLFVVTPTGGLLRWDCPTGTTVKSCEECTDISEIFAADEFGVLFSQHASSVLTLCDTQSLKVVRRFDAQLSSANKWCIAAAHMNTNFVVALCYEEIVAPTGAGSAGNSSDTNPTVPLHLTCWERRTGKQMSTVQALDFKPQRYRLRTFPSENVVLLLFQTPGIKPYTSSSLSLQSACYEGEYLVKFDPRTGQTIPAITGDQALQTQKNYDCMGCMSFCNDGHNVYLMSGTEKGGPEFYELEEYTKEYRNWELHRVCNWQGEFGVSPLGAFCAWQDTILFDQNGSYIELWGGDYLDSIDILRKGRDGRWYHLRAPLWQKGNECSKCGESHMYAKTVTMSDWIITAGCAEGHCDEEESDDTDSPKWNKVTKVFVWDLTKPAVPLLLSRLFPSP